MPQRERCIRAHVAPEILELLRLLRRGGSVATSCSAAASASARSSRTSASVVTGGSSRNEAAAAIRLSIARTAPLSIDATGRPLYVILWLRRLFGSVGSLAAATRRCPRQRVTSRAQMNDRSRGHGEASPPSARSRFRACACRAGGRRQVRLRRRHARSARPGGRRRCTRAASTGTSFPGRIVIHIGNGISPACRRRPDLARRRPPRHRPLLLGRRPARVRPPGRLRAPDRPDARAAPARSSRTAPGGARSTSTRSSAASASPICSRGPTGSRPTT